ncbi:MAG: hypothetical protein KDA60_04995, partial [Planctomycetales bacterium]|nr:hypothetical protein [Planctomycetales bacterium]
GHAAVSRGGSGGGAARAAAARTPSMSRPAVTPSRPSFPSGGATRPGNTRPGNTRPSPGVVRPTPPTRPAPTRPTINPGGVRPAPGRDRPNLGGDRPNLAGPNLGSNRPGIGERPGVAKPLPATRPSRDDLGDFLRLPADRPNLPGNISNPPNLGNRRPATGDVRVNVGNQVAVRDTNLNQIRSHWGNATTLPFERNWWDTHRPDFNNPGWRWHGYWNRYPGYWYWRPATWVAYSTWFPWQWATPYQYSYGTNVVYRDNYVYVNDQQVATAEEYYTQAETLADKTPETKAPESTEWMPLGVFALADADGHDRGMVIQLAVSKEGMIAGTFYNELSDKTHPLQGTVDRESQRAAWRFADGANSDLVMETVVYNLTEDNSTALVHYGPDKTETWTLVRLPEPTEQEPNSNPS